ncbi:unnamed protein product [Closterium sp. NIES-65]|nr:unnamed protein product [Closterium sp. NIES-65]
MAGTRRGARVAARLGRAEGDLADWVDRVYRHSDFGHSGGASRQVRQFQPSLVSVQNPALVGELRRRSRNGAHAGDRGGDSGIVEVRRGQGGEVLGWHGILMRRQWSRALWGGAGLKPTVAAIEAGKDIALANKETLIAGGPYVLPLAKKHGCHILPADIGALCHLPGAPCPDRVVNILPPFNTPPPPPPPTPPSHPSFSPLYARQCIQGLPEGGLRRIILTASGGAFRDWPVEKLKEVTPADALKHPNWSMGRKITVDSATLMNKVRGGRQQVGKGSVQGLEVIEAHYLFGADYDNIDIVITLRASSTPWLRLRWALGMPELAVSLCSSSAPLPPLHASHLLCFYPLFALYSLWPLQDSSVLAQLGWPDMRLPILYTLSWPDRVPTSEVTWPRLDFIKCCSLALMPSCTHALMSWGDRDTYPPSIVLLYAGGRAGGTMTGVLSAANEQAVEMFLDDKIHYLDICRVIEGTCDRHRNDLVLAPSLEDIVHFDQWARVYAAEVASKLSTVSV